MAGLVADSERERGSEKGEAGRLTRGEFPVTGVGYIGVRKRAERERERNTNR